MANMLLISGGPHGSWVWDSVKGLLEDAQRQSLPLYHNLYVTDRVLALDLPGHGSRFCHDHPAKVTFDGCVQHVLETARELPDLTLVAHSLAGHMALEVARRLPTSPRRIILVGAAIPEPPKTVLETLPITTLMLLEGLRLLPGNPPGAARLHREVTLKLLCNTLDYPQAATTVLSRLRPIPLAPYQAWSTWDMLDLPCPATYVVLTRDRFLYPPLQRRMASWLPGATVVEIAADHEAPVSNPTEVAQALMKATLNPRYP